MPLLGSLSSIDGEYSAQSVYVTESAVTIDEGMSVTFNINATGVADGSTLYYTTSGTVNSSDLSAGSLSGSFVLSNFANTITMTLSNDLSAEGTEHLTLEVRAVSTSGPIIATSKKVTVIDTSTAPYGSLVVYGSGFPTQSYATANAFNNSYNWVVPSGVTSISIVCVGAGAGGMAGGIYTAASGGGGGAASYRNNVSVTPGETLKLWYGEPADGQYYNKFGGLAAVYRVSGNVFIVGAYGGTTGNETPDSNPNGTAYQSPAYRMNGSNGLGSASGSFPTSWSDGGGQGGLGASGVGTSRAGGGGGAGGYGSFTVGLGGYGGNGANNTAAGAGTYGSGGGGGYGSVAGGGGGIDIFGTDGSSAGGAAGAMNQDGGGGQALTTGTIYFARNYPGSGRGFGGGGGGRLSGTVGYANNSGAPGAVRIVWPGVSRQFPSTDVANTSGQVQAGHTGYSIN